MPLQVGGVHFISPPFSFGGTKDWIPAYAGMTGIFQDARRPGVQNARRPSEG